MGASRAANRAASRAAWTNRVDPRVKWAATLALVVVFVSLRNPAALAAGVAVTTAGALAAARVPFRRLGARLAAALPFILVACAAVVWSGAGGPWRAVILSLRVYGAVLAMAVLTLSTERAELFAGAVALGFPRVILDLADLALRYLAVVGEEARRMVRARRARGFEPKVIWRPAAAAEFGSLVGALMLRSLDRSERVYLARLARSGGPAPAQCPGGGEAALSPVRPSRRQAGWAVPPPGPSAPFRLTAPDVAWLGLTVLPAILMVAIERCCS